MNLEQISFCLDKISCFTDKEKFKMYLTYLENEICDILERIEDNPTYENVHEMKNLFVSFYPNKYVLDTFSMYEVETKQNIQINIKKFKHFVGSVYYKLKTIFNEKSKDFD